MKDKIKDLKFMTGYSKAPMLLLGGDVTLIFFTVVILTTFISHTAKILGE